MDESKIEDAKLIIEGVLDMSIVALNEGNITKYQCPICGVFNSDNHNIENYPHDKDCGYLAAMRLYSDLGMGEE